VAVVEPVVAAYLSVGKALERGGTIPYSPRVVGPARSLAGLVGDGVRSVRFETAEDAATVTDAAALSAGQARPVGALGAVEGRIQTLTSRNALRFTLYDSVHDRAVTCYVREDRQDLLRDVWDKRAIVHGWVSRDPATGRPVSIRRVEEITPLREVPRGSYIRARGVVTPLPGMPSPEETIRRHRDAR
jgi:hypothetical protein